MKKRKALRIASSNKFDVRISLASICKYLSKKSIKINQEANTCSKLTIETPEKGVKYVQS